MNRVIFWGATGQAKVLRDALPSHDATLVALFDNRDIDSPFPDVPIFHGETGFLQWEQVVQDRGSIRSCVAIGGWLGKDRLLRMRWLRDRGYAALTVVHPRAFVAKDASIGDGCQILAMSAVCAGTRLGEAVIVNTKASIDHDCIIGDGVHIAPGATLAGDITVGDFAFVGAGAVVLPRLQIGENAIIGAGSIVTRNVLAGETVTGNPARLHHKDKP
jgi:sugar O-acyltransferase (sialic acid O-acetyltransferase NeuD family)